MILDYSEFIEFIKQRCHYGPHQYGLNELDSYRREVGSNQYFPKQGFCPICKVPALKVHEKRAGYVGRGIVRHSDAWLCSKCGWWELEYISGFYGEPQAVEFQDVRVIRQGVLKTFEPEDINVPVQALRTYIKKRPDIIYDIHPRKMEELVQSVLCEFFKCEAKHVGRSYDGGIDLILITADKYAAVQVKRRQSPEKTEPVSIVREFLGAMVLGEFKEGYIVTTADHFSACAEESARRAFSVGAISKLDLIDVNRFFSMFNLVQSDAKEYWRAYMPDWFSSKPWNYECREGAKYQ